MMRTMLRIQVVPIVELLESSGINAIRSIRQRWASSAWKIPVTTTSITFSGMVEASCSRKQKERKDCSWLRLNPEHGTIGVAVSTSKLLCSASLSIPRDKRVHLGVYSADGCDDVTAW